MSANRKWNELPVLAVTLDVLILAAREGRVLIADLTGPQAPYPIVRVRLPDDEPKP